MQAHLDHIARGPRAYCGRVAASALSLEAAACLAPSELGGVCRGCRRAAYWAVLDRSPAEWYGQGHGQCGDEGRAVATHPWSGERYERCQGYEIPLASGARGWTDGRWLEAQP